MRRGSGRFHQGQRAESAAPKAGYKTADLPARHTQIGPCVPGGVHTKVMSGQHVDLRVVHDGGELGYLRADLVGDRAPLHAHGFRRHRWAKAVALKAETTRPAALAGMARIHVAHEVHSPIGDLRAAAATLRADRVLSPESPPLFPRNGRRSGAQGNTSGERPCPSMPPSTSARSAAPSGNK